MSMFPSTTRDLSQLRPRLQNWLREADPAYADAEIEDLSPASTSAGFSNETYAVTIRPCAKQGRTERLILRTAPGNPERAYFPSYDIPGQFQVMSTVQQRSSLPVPRCRWLEEDPELFGAPFFFMDMIEGQIPGDDPLYTISGFVVDANDDQRSAMWKDTVQCLALLAKVDSGGPELRTLQWPHNGQSAASNHLGKWEAHFDWGNDGEIDPDFPEIFDIRRWLRDNVPVTAREGINWGDPRLANFIYRDFRVAGMLDWEIAAIDDPEADLAYYLLMDQMVLEGMGNPKRARPRLAGFGSPTDAIEQYQALTDQPVRHLAYYWVLNGFKLIAMQQRSTRLMVGAGLIDEALARRIRRTPKLTRDLLNIMENGLQLAG